LALDRLCKKESGRKRFVTNLSDIQSRDNQYLRNVHRQLISEDDMLLWLSRGDMKGGTESEIKAAQNQALQTSYQATDMLKKKADSKCRLCQQYGKKIYYIIPAPSILAKRHNIVCTQLHFIL
jgi:hypothetical protein